MAEPRLLRSGLTGAVYIVTRYKVTGLHPETGAELITASTKYEVTAEFEALAREWCKEALADMGEGP